MAMVKFLSMHLSARVSTQAVCLMGSKEVLATKTMTGLQRHEFLVTGLRLRDVYQTSVRAGFVYP